MFERCYLHIGLQKTGTTSIQNSLQVNRGELMTKGFFVPLLDGETNHVALAGYGRGVDEPDAPQLRVYGSKHKSYPAFCAEVERWADELNDAGEGAPTIILSSEHIHQFVTSRSAIERLASLIRRFARETTIVVYLRRQDRVAVSVTSAAIIDGAGVGTPLLPDLDDGLPYFYSYGDIIQRFDEVFGEESVKVRLVQEDDQGTDGVVGDFYSIIGASLFSGLVSVGRVNRSLSLPASLFLARFNEHLPAFAEGRPNPLRGGLTDLLSTITGALRLPTRSRAKRFVEAFHDQNGRVFERMNNDLGRTQLFDNDFTEYPESVLDLTLSTQQSVRIAARLWVAQAEEIARLRQTVREQAGVLASSTSQHQDAEL